LTALKIDVPEQKRRFVCQETLCLSVLKLTEKRSLALARISSHKRDT
jgi:hypothetical protein